MKYQETVCSIVAADLKAGEFGIAVASSSLSVGKNVPFTGAFIGAIAVQGYAGPFFGIAGMKLLRDGVPAARVVEMILADDLLRDNRQVLAIDAAGATGIFSGAALAPSVAWNAGDGYIVGGCGLASKEAVEAAARGFASPAGSLAERLVSGIAALDAAHREPRFESAALRISKNDPFPFIDLRIDAHVEAVSQLQRLFEIWRSRNPVPSLPPGNGRSEGALPEL